jgi:hypothetical protein
MNDKRIANDLLKIAKLLTAKEILLATNRSLWSWEYDSQSRVAKLFVDDRTGNLRLIITETYTKTGIGKGTTKTTIADAKVGTVMKPKLAPIRSILKKHSFSRGRMSFPFSRKWTDEFFGGEDSLGNIIRNYAQEMQPVGADVETKKREILKEIERMTPVAIDQLHSLLKL